ncbi:MAG TPA: translocation/assembly module TamB domain-containing protein [Candidatus Limnocylindrales bacterium]|nr:translocation/assembly module TamB domain-containing protein [Candidatus Limnocylindrales bacterium]
MPLSKRQRKLFLGSGLIIVALLVFWLALPLWFPWLLRPLAASQGAHYDTYSREGYSHFQLLGVTFTNSTLSVSANQLEGLVPSVWLWKLWTRSSSDKPFLNASGWHFSSVPGKGPGGSSVYSDTKDALTIFAGLKRWLPVAQLSNGLLSLDQTSVTAREIRWNRGKLMAITVLPAPVGQVTLSGDLVGQPPFQVEMISDPLGVRSRWRVLPTAVGVELQSTSFWQSNQVDLYAQFDRSNNLPQLASLKASGLVIPGETVSLAPYLDLRGAVSVKWERGFFGLDLNVAAQPLPSETNFPPAKLELHARGDTNSVAIQAMDVSAPWVKANLTRELVLHFRGPLLHESAQFNLTADLSRQPFFPLQGELRGKADFLPGAGRFPRATFQITGTNIGNQTLAATALDITGGLDWPQLILTNTSAQLADGSVAVIGGQLDLASQTVSNGQFLARGPFLRRWLPAAYSYETLTVSGSFHGSTRKLMHEGHLEVSGFSSPELQSLGVRLDWRGQQQTVSEFQLDTFTSAARLQAQGAITNASTQIELNVNSMVLLTNGQTVLALSRPVQMTFVPPVDGEVWKFNCSPFDWTGAGGHLSITASLDWPVSGEMSLSAERASSRLVSKFFKASWLEVELEKLAASLSWSNTPATFDLHLSGVKIAPYSISQTTNSVAELTLGAELGLRGDRDGLTISNLYVYSPTSAVLRVQGFVPLTLTPALATNLIHIEPNKPLQLTASAGPHAFFWKEFTAATGVDLENPRLKLEAAGDWKKPRGELDLRARQLRIEKGSNKLPTLTDLNVTLQLDRTQARLVNTHFLVQGQPVVLTAEVPLDASFWTDLKEKKLPNFDKANARLHIENAELAAFEPLFPNILAPQGTLKLDVSLAAGGKLAGEMALHDARTRPIGNFGPIRDIDVDCRFRDRDLTLERVRAQISGAPVDITGHADLRGTEWLQGQLPPFSLTLHGTNVPLVRQPEAVIRSDLGLTVFKTNSAPPIITGLVHLHDSFFLADVSALIPGKVAGTSHRPPYFSIEDPFLADWRLALKVDGVRFLKVRTPVFNGEVSANLNLQSTLKDPIALGDLKIDSGLVRFPFASLEVQQGLVSLSSQDPYHPQLTVSAASKQFGYDIRMDVTGPVDAPIIQFNSTPPLSSEQILLMVTAGQLPQGTFSLTPQQRAQTMAMFFGRDLLSKLGVGDQSEERLTIKSGQEISEQGRPTYHVEYKLSKDWYLVGEYDRFGDYNAGFKWRILSR